MKTMHRVIAYLGVSVISSLVFATAWLIVQTLSLPEVFLAHGLSTLHHPPFLLGLSMPVAVCAIISWPFYTLLGWRLPPVKVGMITGASALTWIVVATPCNLWVGWPGSYLVLLLSLLVCRFTLKQERPTSVGSLSRAREGSLVTFAHNLPMPRRILLLSVFAAAVAVLIAVIFPSASEISRKPVFYVHPFEKGKIGLLCGRCSDIHDSGHLFIRIVVGGEEAFAMLDTGAMETRFNRSYLQERGFEIADRPAGKTIYGMMGEVHESYEVDIHFQIGPLSVVANNADDFQLVVQAEGDDAPPVVAIIGEDVMKSLHAILSIPDQALLLEVPEKGADVSFPTRDAFSDQEAYYRHPIEFDCPNWRYCFIPFCKKKRTLVETSINGKKMRALLDTGATKTAVNPKALQESGIERVGRAAGGGTTNANGHSHKSERVELEEFRIGKISIAGVRPRTSVVSGEIKKHSCIIGMDVLNATDAHVSYYDKSIYLKRSEAKK